MNSRPQSSIQHHWATQNYPTSRGLAKRLMVYFNTFRLIIATVLLFLVFGGNLSAEYLTITRSVAIIYFANSLITVFLLSRNPDQPHALAQFAFIVDILVAVLLVYLLNTLENGIGLFLVFWCSAAAIILTRAFAFALAGFSSLFITSLAGWQVITQGSDSQPLLIAGLYAVGCFLGTLIFSALASWNRQYEQLVEQNVVDLRNLEQINEIIIRRMRAGVVVVDSQGLVRLMNESAWFLLGSPGTGDQRLSVIAPRLMQSLHNWWAGNKLPEEPEALVPGHSPIIPQFIKIPGTRSDATLVFLQDTTKVSRQASAIATETLAKLSGSIAHEIRNPLAAITNASELLQETGKANPSTRQLLGIIKNQSERINSIIENILQLARQERSRPEVIQMNLELQQLIGDYRVMFPNSQLQIKLKLLPQPGYGLFDRSQFQQVIHQLLDNAATHARHADRKTRITISLESLKGSGQINLEFQDDGPGIPDSIIEQIFEPFFSSHKQGSGLGLYIVQQLCAINQSELSAIPSSQGALFRIIIPAVARHQREKIVGLQHRNGKLRL